MPQNRAFDAPDSGDVPTVKAIDIGNDIRQPPPPRAREAQPAGADGCRAAAASLLIEVGFPEASARVIARNEQLAGLTDEVILARMQGQPEGSR